MTAIERTSGAGPGGITREPGVELSAATWRKLGAGALAMLASILGAAWVLFSYLDDRITRLEAKVDEGFDRVEDKLETTNRQVADLRVELAARGSAGSSRSD